MHVSRLMTINQPTPAASYPLVTTIHTSVGARVVIATSAVAVRGPITRHILSVVAPVPEGRRLSTTLCLIESKRKLILGASND